MARVGHLTARIIACAAFYAIVSGSTHVALDAALEDDDSCNDSRGSCALRALQLKAVSTQSATSRRVGAKFPEDSARHAAALKEHEASALQKQHQVPSQVTAGLCAKMSWLPICKGGGSMGSMGGSPGMGAQSWHAPSPGMGSMGGMGGAPSPGMGGMGSPSMNPVGPPQGQYNYNDPNGLLQRESQDAKLTGQEKKQHYDPCMYMPWLPYCTHGHASWNNQYSPSRRRRAPPSYDQGYADNDDVSHPGTMTLWHETSPQVAQKILASNFRPGHSGWCGGAIYFFGSPDIPSSKLGPDSHTGAIIEVTVDMGRMAHLDYKCVGAQNGFKTGKWDSVTFNPGDGSEYIILDPGRIKSKRRYK